MTASGPRIPPLQPGERRTLLMHADELLPEALALDVVRDAEGHETIHGIPVYRSQHTEPGVLYVITHPMPRGLIGLGGDPRELVGESLGVIRLTKTT